MHPFFTTHRPIVVASLLVGLSTAGVSPCMYAAANCDSDSSRPRPKVCCCKGKCGPLCRMTCCQAPAPKQDRTPALPKLSDEFAPTWGLATAAVAHVDAATSADLRYGFLGHGEGISTPPTLLAFGIRLNV